MYNTIMTIIKSGNFELADLTERINVLYASGKLSTDEHIQLLEAAQEAADPMGGLPDYSVRISNLETSVKQLEARVSALEGGESGEEGGGQTEPSDEYPEWHTPTGSHNAYYNGDKMTYTDGKKYVCTAPSGYGCTYGPDVLPQYWELVEE